MCEHKFLHKCFTTDWALLQFGADREALEEWWLILKVLELDRKAQLDLMCLACSGVPGRAWANRILWYLMSDWALEVQYLDLSRKVSNEVGWARRSFDRPPAGHKDLTWWRWSYLQEARGKADPFSPEAVPRVAWNLATGPGGEPWPPRWCWGPLHQ